MPAPIKLLVIEDNPGDVRLIQERLRDARGVRYEYFVADRIAPAIEILAAERIDVALLDINLPDANGLHGIQRLRNANHNVPIVVMTALDDEAFALDAVKNGSQDYVVKGTADGPQLSRILRYAIERHRLETQITYLAHHDPLTGLANRVVFSDRLEHALSRTDRTGKSTALMVLDLDGFKSVNDTLGHQFGDELLKHVATRLRTCVRGSDTVARLGGDEFAVILEGIRTTNTATAVADKVIDAISAPFELAGQSLAISTSIGLVVYPDCGVEAAITRLYRCADDALYRTKQAGKNRYHLFTEQMGQHLLNRLQFEQDLKRAIAQDEFTVYYQPVVDACSGELVSLEALLRWRHPTLGVLAPGEFLSYLEDSGDIIAVGDSVIGAVCRQLRAWLDAGFPLVPVSINVSPRQLLNCGFADSLLQALSERALDPRLVAIELTENRLIEKSECVQIAVSRLHAAGVRFAIDDFGTGYSAYDYLRAFPVGTIKVHRRFIHKIASSKADRAIAESLIVLARRIGAEVVAKGVETDEQLRELRALDCDAVQGFLMASPSPAEKMERFLGRNGTVTGKRSQRASDRTAAGA